MSGAENLEACEDGRVTPSKPLASNNGVVEGPSVTRRALVYGVGATAILAALGSVKLVGAEALVRPPGAHSDSALISKCIRCYRCSEVCPQNVIIPARVETGLVNMRTPKLSFSDNSAGDLNNLKYCDLCAAANEGQPLCVEKCPTQALCYDAGEAVDGTVLGMAVLNTDLCMAYRSSYCAFCYDACRQVRGEADAAIYFANADALGADATKLPLLDTTKCNGCGACESVCVSTQAGSVVSAKERAIIIKPLSEIAG